LDGAQTVAQAGRTLRGQRGVLQNGDRRAVLLLQTRRRFLREKDIIQPEEANTPAKRIYFPIMMMYLDPAGANQFYDEFVMRLTSSWCDPLNRYSQGMRLALPRGHDCRLLQGADALPEASHLRTGIAG
jgi:hypothetical protein